MQKERPEGAKSGILNDHLLDRGAPFGINCHKEDGIALVHMQVTSSTCGNGRSWWGAHTWKC